MIKVEKLAKIFLDRRRGEVKAVDEISFDCQPGEIFGLLGPNGAGKTTTLRILSTVLKPTAGTATVTNLDVSKKATEVRQKIGFLSGNTGIYEKLTPHEMVAYFGRLYGMSEEQIEIQSEKIFDIFDMNEFAHTLNSKLSSGMRQKVSIARTIIHNPPVLILDEPTVNLDILVAKSVREFIIRCRQENKCIILSTHIMSEAEKLCDRIAIIHKGKIFAQGTLAELQEMTAESDLENIFFSLVNETGIQF